MTDPHDDNLLALHKPTIFALAEAVACAQEVGGVNATGMQLTVFDVNRRALAEIAEADLSPGARAIAFRFTANLIFDALEAIEAAKAL